LISKKNQIPAPCSPVSLCIMIKVSKFDGTEYFINPHQIECIEIRPDTMIVMLSGKKHIVREDADIIIERIENYHRRLNQFVDNPSVVQE